MICRLGKIDTHKYKKLNEVKFQYLTNFHQLRFQSSFFKFGLFNIILQESFYEKKFVKKIKHLFNALKNSSLVGFQQVSSQSYMRYQIIQKKFNRWNRNVRWQSYV